MLPLLLLNGHRLGGWWTIFGGGGRVRKPTCHTLTF